MVTFQISLILNLAQYLFRKIQLTSSWLNGGLFELAAILKGLKKHDTSVDMLCIYSLSVSTSWKQIEFLWRMLSAWGERM